MFFRFLLALCLVTFFTVEIYAKAASESVELEDRSAKGKAVAKILGKIAAGMAASCLAAASEQCAKFWKKPKEALDCGKNYFKQNKGKCAVGR